MSTDVQSYRANQYYHQLSKVQLRRKNHIFRVLSNLKMAKGGANSEIYAAIEELRRENERVVAELSSTQDLLDLFERYRVLIREHMDFCVCAGKDHQMTKWRKYEQEYRQLVPIRSTMVTPPNVCLPKKINKSLNPFINDNAQLNSIANLHSQSSSPVSELSTSTNTTKVQKGTIIIGPSGANVKISSNNSLSYPATSYVAIDSKLSQNGHLSKHKLKHNDLELQVVGSGKSLVRSFLDSSNGGGGGGHGGQFNRAAPNPNFLSNRNVITNSQGNTIVIRKRTIPELIQPNSDGSTVPKMVVIANKKAKLNNLKIGSSTVNNYSSLKNILTVNNSQQQASIEDDQSVEHLDQLNNALDQLLMGRYDALNKIQNQLRNNSNNRLMSSGGEKFPGQTGENDDEDCSSNDNAQMGQDFEEQDTGGLLAGFTQEMFEEIADGVAGEDGDDEDDDDEEEEDEDIIFLDEVKNKDQQSQQQKQGNSQQQQQQQSKSSTILSAALESGYKPYPTYHRIVANVNVSNSLNTDDSASNIILEDTQSKPVLQKRPHLTSEERSNIIGRLKKNESGARIARDYGITKQAVSAIKRRAQLMGDNFQSMNPSYYVALKNNTFAPLSSQLVNSSNKTATITETANGQFVAQRAVPKQQNTSMKPSSLVMSLSSTSGDNSLVARQLKQQKLNDTIIKQTNLLASLPRATSDLVLPVNPVAIIKSQMAKQRQHQSSGTTTNENDSASSSPKLDHKRLLLPRLLQGTETYPPTSYSNVNSILTSNKGNGKIIIKPSVSTESSGVSSLKTLLTKNIIDNNNNNNDEKLPHKSPSSSSNSSLPLDSFLESALQSSAEHDIKQEQEDDEDEDEEEDDNDNDKEQEEAEEFVNNVNDNANQDLLEFDGNVVDQVDEDQLEEPVNEDDENEDEEHEVLENISGDNLNEVARVPEVAVESDDADGSQADTDCNLFENLQDDFDTHGIIDRNNNNDNANEMINFDDIDYIDNNITKPDCNEEEEEEEEEEDADNEPGFDKEPQQEIGDNLDESNNSEQSDKHGDDQDDGQHEHVNKQTVVIDTSQPKEKESQKKDSN